MMSRIRHGTAFLTVAIAACLSLAACVPQAQASPPQMSQAEVAKVAAAGFPIIAMDHADAATCLDKQTCTLLTHKTLGKLVSLAEKGKVAAPIVKTQAGVPTDAISIDTGGYGIIGLDAKDAESCADKSACVLLTEKAAMHISHQLEKAQTQAAQYKAQLDAIKAAKAGSKCI